MEGSGVMTKGQISSAEKHTNPRIDGFLYNPRLLYAPCRSLPLIRENLLDLTNHGFQPRWYLAPPDFRVAIGAGLTSRTQLRIIPGSYIIAYRFTTLGGIAPSTLSYLVQDATVQSSQNGGSGGLVDGQDRFLNCNAIVPTGASGAAYCFLLRPYQVKGGVITVAISNNNTGTGVNCQMLIYVMEPVQSQTTSASGSVLAPTPAQLADLAKQQKAMAHRRQHGGHDIHDAHSAMHPKGGRL
jgi:hypothetical protein